MADLRKELDLWLENIQQSAPAYLNSRKDQSEQDEIQLGINVLIFQYHHLMVFLTRADNNSKKTCLDSARAAISLLDKLVSNSEQVFNGIVWQLLYQPFTPYFVLFANIISNPTSPNCFKDLQLLRQVVLYFLQMHNNHPSARKLERIAETFTRLAEAYVRQSMEQQQAATSGGPYPIASGNRAERASAAHIDGVSTPQTGSSNPGTSSAGIAFDSASEFSSMPSFTASDYSFPTEFDFNDPSSDPMTLLNFFSNSNGAEGVPAASCTADEPMIEPALKELPQNSPELTDWPSDNLMRELRNIGQNPALDCTFDWFSWDQYDTAMG